MAVYVDNAAHQFGRMVMCHMFADTAAELHRMARAIGMDLRWYQGPWRRATGKPPFPHYDVCKMRRRKAVMLGAVEVDRRDGWLIRKRIREEAERTGWKEWGP